jgi:16S rRNA (cytosine1402-N4)-methyltransferase
LDEHKPVLVDEVLAALAVRPAGRYIDATYGRGGHSQRILAALGVDGRLVAIDRDLQAIEAGRARFASEPRIAFVHGAYGEITALLRATDPQGSLYDGILIDCGVSSPQLDNATRGFSFQKDGPLDMRMDAQRGEPVSAWLARAALEEMRSVIASLGQERFARRIAVAIERERARQPLTRTLQLANLISAAVPVREPGKHAATRTFQALRMHINDELGQLRAALTQSVPLLAPGGRLAVLSFHSLEDGVVRDFLRSRSSVAPALAKLPVIPASALPALRLVGRKQRASAAEVHANPRARSALLRVAERMSSVAA